MSRPPLAKLTDDPRYQGFSLSDVTWGYRRIFAERIERLFDQGRLGPEREAFTEQFFGFLKRSSRNGFDHILKDFIEALNPHTHWLMDLPGIFTDVTELGLQFAESKLYLGGNYFRTLGEGGFGDTPRQIRDLLSHLRRLRQSDDELAMAFLHGYRRLLDRLGPEEIARYVAQGERVWRGNASAGVGFMTGRLKSAEAMVELLTRECRLVDVQASLAALLKALVGYEVEVADLGHLDSDELIQRNTRMVLMYRWLYVPARVRGFDSARMGRHWYMLQTVVAAGMLAESSFSRIHGHPDYMTCHDLVGSDLLKLSLFQIVEYVRVLGRIRARWPGARRLLDFGIRTEFRQSPPAGAPERLLRDALAPGSPVRDGVAIVRRIAAESLNCFDTAQRVGGEWTARVVAEYPGLGHRPLRTFAFLPDFLYPGTVSAPPSSSLVADLKRTADRRQNRVNRDHADEKDGSNPSDGHGTGEESDDTRLPRAAFFYDEWSQAENDYYRDHCALQERLAQSGIPGQSPADISEEVRLTRRVFERLRPELARRERHLPDGDWINPDRLLTYLVRRRREPSPKVDFYEKPLITQRDLAVLVLLDVSGSTGASAGKRRVIDIEKHAGVILGEGLSALGDRFAICGFSGNGRENCEYFVYKDFQQPWDSDHVRRLMAARPRSSTRIGVALRHSGYRLSMIEAKQRLIILVTDGKPMDNGYDPHSRYAQYDVRKACEENDRLGIHTFCISTEENSLADLEIMFPNRRFAVLPDIRRLPQVLPKLYLKLTV